MKCPNMTSERMAYLNFKIAKELVDVCNSEWPHVPLCDMFHRGKRRPNALAFENLIGRLTCDTEYKLTEIAEVLACDHTDVMVARNRYRKRNGLQRPISNAPDPTPDEIKAAKSVACGIFVDYGTPVR